LGEISNKISLKEMRTKHYKTKRRSRTERALTIN